VETQRPQFNAGSGANRAKQYALLAPNALFSDCTSTFSTRAHWT
jgi:hypothetical protein